MQAINLINILPKRDLSNFSVSTPKLSIPCLELNDRIQLRVERQRPLFATYTAQAPIVGFLPTSFLQSVWH
jgi:hypothetical protein